MYDVIPTTAVTRLFRDDRTTNQVANSNTAPAAGTTLSTVNMGTVGFWEVTAWAHFGATGDVAGNVVLKNGATTIMIIPMQGGNNTPAVPITCVLNSPFGLSTAQLVNTAAGAVGSIYLTGIVARYVGS